MLDQIESTSSAAAQISERLERAVSELNECVEADPGRRGGVPVLKGTRFTVAQVLAQLADGDSIDDLAANLELDRATVSRLLVSLAALLDRPMSA